MTKEDLAARRGVETSVYQPAEDSRLLAEAAVESISPGSVVVDVGTGSGFVAETIARETGARTVGVDLNPHACERARDRGVPVVRGDLVESFGAGSVDVVVFNPPYLPTDPDEDWGDWMEVALSGGASGRAVIDRFLDDVDRVLTPDGFVLLLVSSVTDVEAVVERAGEAGFSAVALCDVSFPFETLTVLKLLH